MQAAGFGHTIFLSPSLWLSGLPQSMGLFAKFRPSGLPQNGHGNHKTQLEAMRGTEVTPRGPGGCPWVGIPDRPGAGPAMSLTLFPA